MDFLWEEERYADLRILFDDGDKPGHAVVLVRASPVWRKRFLGPAHACKKDASMVDMRGHDCLFMKMVYGYELGDAKNIAWPPTMDAIALADQYDVSDVSLKLRDCIRRCIYDHSLPDNMMHFIKAWSHWGKDNICVFYADEIGASLARMAEQGCQLPREAQWYIIDHCNVFTTFTVRHHPKHFLTILMDRWGEEKKGEGDRKGHLLATLDALNISMLFDYHHYCEDKDTIMKNILEQEPDEFFDKLERKMVTCVSVAHQECSVVQMLCNRYTGRKRRRSDDDP